MGAVDERLIADGPAAPARRPAALELAQARRTEPGPAASPRDPGAPRRRRALDAVRDLMLVDGRPETIYALFAFLVAAVLAWLLVPLAERLAWRIGAIDYPNERSLHTDPTPEARRAGDLRRDRASPAILFLPWAEQTQALLAGAVVIVVGRGARRRLRAQPAAEARRADGRRGDPGPQRRQRRAPSRCRSSARSTCATVELLRRRPLIGSVHLGHVLTILGIVAVINVINFIDGVDGLAAGVCVISAATLADHRALARPARRRGARRAHRRRRARLPAPRLPARLELHGRHRLEPARLPARGDRRPGGAEDERRRRPVLPAGRARGADPRHRLRDREADQVPPADLPRRPLALPPPDGEHRLLAAAHARLPLRLGAGDGRAWRWRCASSRTPTTTATSTRSGRR